MNPVQLEIVKIDRQWQQEVKQHLDTPLFICLGERHELNLFEAYFKYQLSDEGTSNDLFLLHYQPFEQGTRYGQSLIDEWKEVYDLWQAEEAKPISWNTDAGEAGRYRTDAYKPVVALETLIRQYPQLKTKKIFVHLAPARIADLKDFGLWVQEWCTAAQALPQLKLVYGDHHAHRTLKHAEARREFRLQIDIGQMMQHAAAYTNPQKNEPEADYQQQILIASNFISKGQHSQGHTALERAIAIAQRQGSNEAEATARLMLAQSLAAIRRRKEAHRQYHLALGAAGTESLIGAQMHMNYGSFLLMEARKAEARSYFNKATEIAERLENGFMALECTRIAGQLSESKWNGPEKAMSYYRKCIEMGKGMPLERRRQSSMAYVALTIEKIYGPEHEESIALDRDMQEHIGADWRQLAVLPDQYAPTN
ncbi:tetratricopeptide repeat protein [Taibaiella koreensis]|uniref:hypothetical protein n=1 Tax=Taibaiella koreensis TaxID=1268548 RepID=UPI000E59DF3B|nr:hypothetical protein [Taibaiella koreensis]